MAVQLHLVHSSRFCGAGIVAGGPYRCAQLFRAAAFLAEDAFEQSAINLCMHPLVPQTAPNAEHLAQLARTTAGSGEIDPIANLAGHRIYIFTGRGPYCPYQRDKPPASHGACNWEGNCGTGLKREIS